MTKYKNNLKYEKISLLIFMNSKCHLIVPFAVVLSLSSCSQENPIEALQKKYGTCTQALISPVSPKFWGNYQIIDRLKVCVNTSQGKSYLVWEKNEVLLEWMTNILKFWDCMEKALQEKVIDLEMWATSPRLLWPQLAHTFHTQIREKCLAPLRAGWTL